MTVELFNSMEGDIPHVNLKSTQVLFVVQYARLRGHVGTLICSNLNVFYLPTRSVCLTWRLRLVWDLDLAARYRLEAHRFKGAKTLRMY